jgi:hypothetical protein
MLARWSRRAAGASLAGMTTDASAAPGAQQELGPVDIVVIGFPPGAPMTGEAAPMLVDLVDRGIIRVFDVLFLTKDEDGTIAGFDAQGLGRDRIGDFVVFAGANSGLIGDDDISQAAAALEPGASAVMIVFENRWAAPFATAVRKSGAQLVASGRIPINALLETLDELEATEA